MEFLLSDVTSTSSQARRQEPESGPQLLARQPQRLQASLHRAGLHARGSPALYEVFAGNHADVTTVEDIVRMMEEKYGAAERFCVMYRGMTSETNIAFLRAPKARYIVGTPKSELRHFEAALLRLHSSAAPLQVKNFCPLERSGVS